MSKIKSFDTGISMIFKDAFTGTKADRPELDKLNMGLIDHTPSGKLILTVMLAFAEFERDMIVERTQEGREIARQNPNYRDGRKKKYTPQQMEHALAMLKKNSYNQVAAMTGISKSTLIRTNKEKIK